MRNGLEPPERALLIGTGLFLLAVFFMRDLWPMVQELQNRAGLGV
ncbi:hypothetical protein [Xanthomonas euvesicatoria]|nr:hypothetical protein [Xanthomonas euvesicatoria]